MKFEIVQYKYICFLWCIFGPSAHFQVILMYAQLPVKLSGFTGKLHMWKHAMKEA